MRIHNLSKVFILCVGLIVAGCGGSGSGTPKSEIQPASLSASMKPMSNVQKKELVTFLSQAQIVYQTLNEPRAYIDEVLKDINTYAPVQNDSEPTAAMAESYQTVVTGLLVNCKNRTKTEKSLAGADLVKITRWNDDAVGESCDLKFGSDSVALGGGIQDQGTTVKTKRTFWADLQKAKPKITDLDVMSISASFVSEQFKRQASVNEKHRPGVTKYIANHRAELVTRDGTMVVVEISAEVDLTTTFIDDVEQRNVGQTKLTMVANPPSGAVGYVKTVDYQPDGFEKVTIDLNSEKIFETPIKKKNTKKETAELL